MYYKNMVENNNLFDAPEYPKLVRDNIPEIIKNAKQTADFIVANNDDFDFYLRKKIIEEAKELVLASNSKGLEEETADLLEVISSFLEFKKLKSIDELKVVRDVKAQTKGTFNKKIIMTKYNK